MWFSWTLAVTMYYLVTSETQMEAILLVKVRERFLGLHRPFVGLIVLWTSPYIIVAWNIGVLIVDHRAEIVQMCVNAMWSSAVTCESLRVAVLMTDDWLESHYDYAEIVESFISTNLNESAVSFTRFYCKHGDVPTLERLSTNFDVVLISGSRCDANSTTIEWICQLRELTRVLIEHSSLKLLGIGFGSQLLASVLPGGSTGRVEIGWVIGCENVRISLAKLGTVFPDYQRWLPDCERSGDATDIKQDELSEYREVCVLQLRQNCAQAVPNDAVVLGASDGCPIEAFAAARDAESGEYRVLATQGHPQFDSVFVDELLQHKDLGEIEVKHVQSDKKPTTDVWRAVFQRHLFG